MSVKTIDWLRIDPDRGNGAQAISNYTQYPHTGRDQRGPINVRVRSQQDSDVYDEYSVIQKGAGLTLTTDESSITIAGGTTSVDVSGASNALSLTFKSYNESAGETPDMGKFIYYQGDLGNAPLLHYLRGYGVPQLVSAQEAGGAGGVRTMQIAMYPHNGRYYIGVWDYHSIDPETEPDFFLTSDRDTTAGAPIARPKVTDVEQITNVISFSSANDIIPSTYILSTSAAQQTINNGATISPDYGSSAAYDYGIVLNIPRNLIQYSIVWKVYVEARVHQSSAEITKTVTITQGSGSESIHVAQSSILLEADGTAVNNTVISNTSWIIVESPNS